MADMEYSRERPVQHNGTSPRCPAVESSTTHSPKATTEALRPQQVSSETITGCLLGTAAGDSIALPYEGISAERQTRLFRGPYKHRLLFGRGMISDDTEHQVMVAQALTSSVDVMGFKKELARRVKLWAALLPGGVGFATLRSALKLWAGVSPEKSGVYSAGNGPCMRSALLGILFGDDPHKLLAYVSASSRLTHSDPRATSGALAIAVAAHLSATRERVNGEEYLNEVQKMLLLNDDRELAPLLKKAADSALRGESCAAFARSIGLAKGVSGFVLHTVPIAIQAWLSSPNDFREAINQVIACGGDTDTTAAIVGGIIGARVKEAGIPEAWLKEIWEPTFGLSYLRELGAVLARSRNERITLNPPDVSLPLRFSRNLLFLGVILTHGFRRLAPPY